MIETSRATASEARGYARAVFADAVEFLHIHEYPSIHAPEYAVGIIHHTLLGLGSRSGYGAGATTRRTVTHLTSRRHTRGPGRNSVNKCASTVVLNGACCARSPLLCERMRLDTSGELCSKNSWCGDQGTATGANVRHVSLYSFFCASLVEAVPFPVPVLA